MAYLYSLTDSSLYLEIPVSDSLRLRRRVVSVETLEGTQSRDLGASASDLAFSFKAKLDSDTLDSLSEAAAAGSPLGFSLASSSYEVLLRALEAERLPNKNFLVKIDMAVTRSLDPVDPSG
jgi:hypothetical protein